MDESRDKNDTRQISFVVDEDEVDWIDKRLNQLKEYDPGFYVRIIGVGDTKYLYKITTQQKNLEHDDAKKFLFQLELRFGPKLKIR